MPRTFETPVATRGKFSLLLGIFGPSGAGKTYSALRLATGITSITGGDTYVVDTENGRSRAYADAFRFRHLALDAPFSSADYLAAARHCVANNAGCIIIDSASHEHDGAGGYLQTQEKELARLSQGDPAKAERVRMLAWSLPSRMRQDMINGLLQLQTNLVFCFRAKEKVKPVKVNGKTEVVEQGWQPIAGPNLLFEMMVNVLLLPGAGGVPTWRPEHDAERAMCKLPEQFKTLFATQQPLSEEIGASLARWAKGDAIVGEDAEAPLSVARQVLAESAAEGSAKLKTVWDALTAAQKRELKPSLESQYKPIAAKIDAAMRDARGAH